MLTRLAGYKVSSALKPEKNHILELIWEQRLTDELYGTVSLYNYDMKDLIDTRLDQADSLLQFSNVNSIRANGIEMELHARLSMGLQGYANYSFQKAKDVDANKELTNSPNHLFKLGLAYPVSQTVSTTAELQYESARVTVYGLSFSSYALTNVNISWKPVMREGAFLSSMLNHSRLSLKVSNVFNTIYSTPGGFEHRQQSIQQDGRNFLVKLDFNF